MAYGAPESAAAAAAAVSAGPFYLAGSPYSTGLRDASTPYNMGWSSDSSQQLYRTQSSDKDKDKKQACSGLLIATSTLVVVAVLAIAAVAAYLGGKSVFIVRHHRISFVFHLLAPFVKYSENQRVRNS